MYISFYEIFQNYKIFYPILNKNKISFFFYRDEVETKVLSLHCINGRLINDDTEQQFKGLLECDTDYTSEFFIRKNDGSCPKTLFVLGLNISGQILSFAESCYDMINQRVYYVHYRAMKPSQYIASYIPEIFLIDNAYDEVRNWDQVDDRVCISFIIIAIK